MSPEQHAELTSWSPKFWQMICPLVLYVVTTKRRFAVEYVSAAFYQQRASAAAQHI